MAHCATIRGACGGDGTQRNAQHASFGDLTGTVMDFVLEMFSWIF